MAVHPNSLKALEENRKNTQFCGESAVINQQKSAESQRRKKTLAELASIFGNLKADEKTCELLKKQGVDDENLTHDMGMIYGLYASAMRGNSNAGRVIAELRGDLKQQQTNVTVNNGNPLASLTDEELFAEIKRIKSKNV